MTAEGTFISHEHPTAGTARIITLEDGSRVLRLVGLDTDNGPDLKVWLAAAPVIEGRDGWFVFDDDEYLSLGALKGNKGNQNYPIPDDADISDLTSVTIWCERFSVSFGAGFSSAARSSRVPCSTQCRNSWRLRRTGPSSEQLRRPRTVSSEQFRRDRRDVGREEPTTSLRRGRRLAQPRLHDRSR